MLLLLVILSNFFCCLNGKFAATNNENVLGYSTPPHIIFILADDLGWNDIGFHGSNEIPTPNIDALAYNGVILNNYHVLPVCTPSRSALMTGRHPIHNGMQHRVLFGLETRGLPLNEKLLPQYLKKLSYKTHIVGKWHLGFYKKEYTPLYRGFDSHIGFWTGHHDYFDHTAEEDNIWGLDMRHEMEPGWKYHGHYSTHIFTKQSVKIIKNHNTTEPMFLYIAHAAVHSGNKYNPLPAPDATVEKLRYIKNYNRRRFGAMVSELDTSVGHVIRALYEKDMLSNSIIVFSTDNGGPAHNLNYNHASNYPLRGVKNTLWEGGTRGVGIVWSPRILNPGRVSHQMMHITDWLPTLYAAAGGNVQELGKHLDGFNMWNALVDGSPSPRREVLHNIDDIFGNAALTLDNWKLLKGTTYNGNYDGWYGPDGRDPEYHYNIAGVLTSPANRAFSTVQNPLDTSKIRYLRREATITCGRKVLVSTEPMFSNCRPLEKPCLFDIVHDPCEVDNLADRHPNILRELEKRLNEWNRTAVPPARVHKDPHGDPKYHNYVWTDFGDYEDTSY